MYCMAATRLMYRYMYSVLCSTNITVMGHVLLLAYSAVVWLRA